jgi:hypothetical protein
MNPPCLGRREVCFGDYQNFQVMGIGLVICCSIFNHQNINFLVPEEG